MQITYSKITMKLKTLKDLPFSSEMVFSVLLRECFGEITGACCTARKSVLLLCKDAAKHGAAHVPGRKARDFNAVLLE